MSAVGILKFPRLDASDVFVCLKVSCVHTPTRQPGTCIDCYCSMTSVGRWAFLMLVLALSSTLSMADDDSVPPHSEDEIQEAKEEFQSIDTNSDGYITKEEILEMEEVPEPEEVEEFFATYDTDKDGRVSFEEILASDESLREAEEKEL